MMGRVRVLIAEDHVLVRAGLCSLLRRLEGVEVVGEAGTGREAVDLASRLHPDVILMDIAMPDLNGIDAAARVSETCKDARVIIVSMYANETYVREAVKAGAAGYLVKGADVEELGKALVAVARGESYFSPSAAKYLVKITRQGGDPAAAAHELTSRQREILQLVAEGHTSKEIAQMLGVSFKTVEAHRAQIMTRLKLRNVSDLVRHAIRLGLIHAEP
jgi:DNA-binding NarL/FixJ family response regulator